MKGCKQGIWFLALVLAASTALHGCGKEQPAPAPVAAQPSVAAPVSPAPVPAAVAVAPAAAPAITPPVPANPQALPPDQLDKLLAPVALYPDALLAQVLISSTKPQEVLDGGNWVIANPDVRGTELEKAAKAVGFTPPMIALMAFPTVLDMMCMKMEWTTALGEAVIADQEGVRASVQRLRKQASDMGNLQSSEHLKVENQTKNDQNVIVVQSPDPTIVYVPQYDPVTTYTTPAPAAAPAAATTTATSTTVTESSGYSTGALVTTGLLAFGAGILVNEAFDDDDDDWGHYGGYPYYPAYGNGFYPSNGYHNNNNNNYNYNKNTNINIDSGANRFGDRERQDRERPDRDGNRQDWKGKNDYAGARPELRDKAGLADRSPRENISDRKNPQGSYAGAKPGTRDIKRPSSGVTDRGRSNGSMSRPTSQMARPDTGLDKKSNAFQGARSSGKQERAASKRGKQSMQRSGGGNRSGGNRGGGRRR